MQLSQLSIPVTGSVGLLIYSSSAPLFEVEDAADFGESKWQLLEGREYDYELIEAGADAVNWCIQGSDAVFLPNPRHRSRGKIKTGIYVGTLSFEAVNTSTGISWPLRIEIQSVKADYRNDYRKMLTDITSYYTDLVMQQGSPVTQRFEVDYDAAAQTLYQKFAFIRSIVDNDSFEESIHKIVSNPVRKWTETVAERRIESVRRISRSCMRQIAVRTDRVCVDNGPAGLQSLPRRLAVAQKTDTVDTHENQFIKYALTSFYSFCSSLATKENATPQLRCEVEAVCEKLAGYLNSSFFKQVSRPTRLNIGSPVLQRKEGYREILQAWLMFDLAARITWDGGDTVYDAGKKNVAVLYEYWLFFKLIEVVSEVFHVDAVSKERLVNIDDKDAINLDIRQGKMSVVEGKYDSGNRRLNVRLAYNRTFGFQKEVDRAGSWTMSMRPDYTLSIWPGDDTKTEAEAESDDSIVHIHFDAKYRLNRILIDDSAQSADDVETELVAEKNDREIDIYKRGDLLKMHAYKDAIRRTGGAYVLYPGTEKGMKCGFHEIIPGLGAFCIAPGHEEDQLPHLKSFLLEIVRHFLDRTSQREKIAQSSHEIYNKKSINYRGRFPEPPVIHSFPDTTFVLVGCIKSREHLNWIHQRNEYNIRLGGGRKGSVSLLTPLIKAQYLLLYDYATKQVEGFYKIMTGCPRIVTSEKMAESGYPSPTPKQAYLVFDISADQVESELRRENWNTFKVKAKSAAPTMTPYSDLIPKNGGFTIVPGNGKN